MKSGVQEHPICLYLSFGEHCDSGANEKRFELMHNLEYQKAKSTNICEVIFNAKASC